MNALPLEHRPIESVSVKRWKKQEFPKKLLVIRIQALGDLFACLPIISALKVRYPEIEMDLLCREDFAVLPESFALFRKVYRLKGGRSGKKLWLHAIQMIPQLRKEGYQVVIDLQRNKQSRLIRKGLHPEAYTEFDRASPYSVLLRNRWSAEQIGFPNLEPDYTFVSSFREENSAIDKLREHGWKGQALVVLNPAGFSETRNWPLKSYIDFVDRWLEKSPETRFLILGTDVIAQKAAALVSERPEVIINLVGQTTLKEMYTVLLRSEIILTEDSGLGHIAWLSGKKTVMMLGSTRSDWARPIGDHTICYDSSHFFCGNCMKMVCPLGTNACMTDLEPGRVFESSWKLCGL